MSESCSCGEKAEIGATVKFHCKACANVIDKFTVKKPLKAAGLAAILAYGGSQFIDYAITDNRYPLDVEYAVLEACASSYNNHYLMIHMVQRKNYAFVLSRTL